MAYLDLFVEGVAAVENRNVDEVIRIATLMKHLNPHLPHSLNLERACAESLGHQNWLRDANQRLESSIPYYRDVGLWLASDSLRIGDFAGARLMYDKALSRPASITPTDQLPGGVVTLARLRHDSMQFRYLRERGVVNLEPKLAGCYEALVSKYFAESTDPNSKVSISALEMLSIAEFYRRCVYLKEDIPMRCEAVTRKDICDFIKEYSGEGHSQPVAVIDDVFSRDVADNIYAFLLESTIWHCDTHNGAYIGSNDLCGLGHPLLHTAAREIETALHRKGMPNAQVQQFWCFRCVHREHGIGLHADVAKMNLNVWLTPDKFVRDADKSGLRIYDARRPAGWSHEEFNGGDKMKKIVTESDHVEIAYKYNRGVLFDSRCFHESMSGSSDLSYEGLRTNLTFAIEH